LHHAGGSDCTSVYQGIHFSSPVLLNGNNRIKHLPISGNYSDAINARVNLRQSGNVINEGTRSGKEASAYQLKKNRRALLIRVTTQETFSAGEGIFSESDKPFFCILQPPSIN
jgi:hypothetical protein